MSRVKFENLGYSKDYYIGSTYIGSLRVERDRETLGYYGRRLEVLQEPIEVGKIKLSKGSVVKTELHQISGRILKNV